MWGMFSKPTLEKWIDETQAAYRTALLRDLYAVFPENTSPKSSWKKLSKRHLKQQRVLSTEFWQQAEIGSDFAQKIEKFLHRFDHGAALLKIAGLVAHGMIVADVSDQDRLLVLALATLLRAEQQSGVVLVTRSALQTAAFDKILQPLTAHRHKTFCLEDDLTQWQGRVADIYVMSQDKLGEVVLQDLAKEHPSERLLPKGILSLIIADVDFTAVSRSHQPFYRKNEDKSEEQRRLDALRQVFSMIQYLEAETDYYADPAAEGTAFAIKITEQGAKRLSELSDLFSERHMPQSYLLEYARAALIVQHVFQKDQHYRVLNEKLYPLVSSVAAIIGPDADLYLNLMRLKEGLPISSFPEILARIRMCHLLQGAVLLGGVSSGLSEAGQDYLRQCYRFMLVPVDADEGRDRHYLPEIQEMRLLRDDDASIPDVLSMMQFSWEREMVPLIFAPDMEHAETLLSEVQHTGVKIKTLPENIASLGDWQMLLSQAQYERIGLLVTSSIQLEKLQRLLGPEDEVRLIFIGEIGLFYDQRAMALLQYQKPDLTIGALVSVPEKAREKEQSFENVVQHWQELTRQERQKGLAEMQNHWWQAQEDRDFGFFKMEQQYAHLLPFLERVHL